MSSIQDEIDEILTDCYGEYEQMSGWENAFLDEVEVPFQASLLGIPVEVQDFRVNDANALQCQIMREDKQRWVGIEDLDAEGLPEDFQHLLKLYRVWLGSDA
jgi:hypothetical protein